ncbi:peroxisomal membrane protein PEX14 isoform X1 [Diorhabda sublineata]|uniref:peroxisomal membrane protein PEX14 isoform X1 n=1 Tax=Diorhabda sublineata TaxID=1163346 RepID=UPI0024E0FF84|nr:peroxisomal membrane protein PEX14 isoform X1 [Diorhabda sublineata]
MASPVNVPNENNSVREEMVQTAIKFLENPNVVNTPLVQKQKFLQRKGLTDKEIQLACEKSGTYVLHDQQNRLPPPLPQPNMLNNYPLYSKPLQLTVFDRIREVLHNIAVFSIVAYVIHKFYERFIAPFLFGKKKKSIEESIEELDNNIKSSVSDLKEDLHSVKVELDKVSDNSDNQMTRQLSELKLEIASVKGLLLGRKQFPSVANTPVIPPSIPAWQMSSVPPDGQDDHKEEEEEEELGSGSSEPEHGMKTSESSLEIIYSSRDCDSESCHSRKSNKDDIDKD